MILKSTKKIFQKTVQEMSTLEDEYQTMARKNKLKSSEISASIREKSELFKKTKKERNKHFDFIRSK